MWNSEVCTCTVYLYQEGNNTFFPLPLSISPFFASLFSIYQQCRMHRQTDIPARREDFFFCPWMSFLASVITQHGKGTTAATHPYFFPPFDRGYTWFWLWECWRWVCCCVYTTGMYVFLELPQQSSSNGMHTIVCLLPTSRKLATKRLTLSSNAHWAVRSCKNAVRSLLLLVAKRGFRSSRNGSTSSQLLVKAAFFPLSLWRQQARPLQQLFSPSKYFRITILNGKWDGSNVRDFYCLKTPQKNYFLCPKKY